MLLCPQMIDTDSKSVSDRLMQLLREPNKSATTVMRESENETKSLEETIRNITIGKKEHEFSDQLWTLLIGESFIYVVSVTKSFVIAFLLLNIFYVPLLVTKCEFCLKCAECNSYEQVSVSFDTIFQQVRNGICKPYVSLLHYVFLLNNFLVNARISNVPNFHF